MEETCKTAPKDPMDFDETTLENAVASNGVNISIEPSKETQSSAADVPGEDESVKVLATVSARANEVKRNLRIRKPAKPRIPAKLVLLKRKPVSVSCQTNFTSTKRPGRYETSLFYLALKFMTLIKQSDNGELNLNHASRMLETQKRRLYDITNVLEGINLIKKKSKNTIKWLGEHLVSKPPVDNLAEEEEKRIDQLIASCSEELFQLFRVQRRYAYLTNEDVFKVDVLKDQVVMVIKSPAETKVEVSHPHQRLQVHISSTLGPIDVLICTGPT